MTDLTKAIKLTEKAIEQLQKSHVKQYTRSDGTVVKEHDDSRQKQSPEARMYQDRSEKAEIASGEARQDDSYSAHTNAAKMHRKAAEHAPDSDTAFKHRQQARKHDERAKTLSDRSVAERKAQQRDLKEQYGNKQKETDDQEPVKKFNKGDKVKDEYGKTHEVLEQRGNSVKTYQSGSNWIHASKLWPK